MDKKYRNTIMKCLGSTVFCIGGILAGVLIIAFGILSILICLVWEWIDFLLKKWKGVDGT